MTSASPLRRPIGLGLEELSRQECLQRLARGGIGRLGIMDEGLPTVLPVNYAFIDDLVVMRTGVGSILRVARDREMVAFEIDATDPFYHGGSSVLVRGHARELVEPGELMNASAAPLRAWGNPDADRFVAVATEIITGRRISWSSHPVPSPPGR